MTQTTKTKPTKAASPDKPKRPVKVYPIATTIEIAPNETHTDLPPDLAVRVGIVKWIPVGDGLFRPRVQIVLPWVRVTQAHQYGVEIKRETLVRLGNAGFIGISLPSPGCTMINLHDLFQHIENCRDPEFWNEERTKRYLQAIRDFR